jgi:hypothetical protein
MFRTQILCNAFRASTRVFAADAASAVSSSSSSSSSTDALIERRAAAISSIRLLRRFKSRFVALFRSAEIWSLSRLISACRALDCLNTRSVSSRVIFLPRPNEDLIRQRSLSLPEEASLPYETIPVDTSKGEQHKPAFRAINPGGKVPAIVGTEGPGGKEARVFDPTAILIYLAEKTGKFLRKPEDRSELLSWLLFIASGLAPFSGQAVHFQFAASEGLHYAVNRYRRTFALAVARRCAWRFLVAASARIMARSA